MNSVTIQVKVLLASVVLKLRSNAKFNHAHPNLSLVWFAQSQGSQCKVLLSKLILRSNALPLMAALLLAGCMVGPDYVKPSAPVPEAYKETENWKSAEPRDNQPKGAWWEIYKDPVLNGLMQKVSVNNQNIIAAEAQYRQARALVDAAQAGLFPNLNLEAASGRGGAVSNKFQSAGLSASWEPDLWGGIRRSVEANKANAQASAASLEGALLSTRSTLAQSYFQLRITDVQKQMYDDTVEAYKKSFKITENQFKMGVASQLDLSEAQTLLQSTEALAIDINVTRAQLEHAIAVLVGESPSKFSLTPEKIEFSNDTNAYVSSVAHVLDHLAPVPPGLPAHLLERRPDIASAERLMNAANAKIGVAQAAFFPTPIISASGGYQSAVLPNLISAPNKVWAIGPSAALAVFDGGARLAAKQQANAAYDQSVASYRQTVLSAFQNVEDNLVAVKLLEAEIVKQTHAVDSARRATRIALNQYKAGIVNYLTVVTNQVTQLNNERILMTLQNRRISAHISLIVALGGNW